MQCYSAPNVGCTTSEETDAGAISALWGIVVQQRRYAAAPSTMCVARLRRTQMLERYALC